MTTFDKVITVCKNDYSNINEICNRFGISEITAKVLINRGLNTIKEVEAFLFPTIDKLFDPFLMKDMDKAVERVVKAVKDKESIWVYGDYDVDGVTSTSILKIFFKSLGINVNYYIPDRMTEGYGLNTEAIEYIHDKGGQLIITVDCGITSFEEVNHCNKMGMDIIITDHHQCGSELPDAVAVLNPNRRDCTYPFKKLAGVGVAFKLIQALAKALSAKVDYNEILPITAVGTVADVVSLTGENRIIVKHGLELISSCKNLGIQALIEVSGLKSKKISSGHIGFVIGPRINATGRIGLAKYGVELLTTEDKEEAYKLAKKLDKENNERQGIEKEILKQAQEIIERDIDIDKEKVIVVASKDWHPGVIGIVSSRITDKYYRPSIVITIEKDSAKGSARSIPAFDIYEALKKCRDLMSNFGGHKQAAGLSLDVDNISLLREKINLVADEDLDDIDLIPEIVVDTIINVEDLTIDIARELNSLQPFGVDNSKPEFLIRNAKVKSIRQIGNDNKHLKIIIESNGIEIDCIGFNLGEYFNNITPNESIDIICSLEINNYLGEEKIQLTVKEILNNYNVKDNIIEKYYLSMKNILLNYCKDNVLSNNIEFKLNSSERLGKTIDELRNDNRTLVLVNNYYSIEKIINELKLAGRDIIKRTAFSFSLDDKSKDNCVLINADIKNIDYKRYDGVILFDFGYSLSYIKCIVNQLKKESSNFHIFISKRDLEDSIRILEELIPSVEELRIIYKSLIRANNKVCKINIEKFTEYLMENHGLSINRMKLQSSMDILKEGGLIDYKTDSGMCYVKLLEKPKEKIDIDKLQIYKMLNITKRHLLNLVNKNFDV